MKHALLFGLLLFLLPLPAQAALSLCNRTSYILYAATLSVHGPARVGQGWTRLVPGTCEIVLKTPLTGQSTAVYVRSALAHSGPQRAWGGNLPGCVREGNFNFHQSGPSVCSGDYFSVPYASIDTRGHADWTMNLDESPALTSMTVAQLAGVKRLLKDNGLAVGAIGGPPDKATGKSLQAFRSRMHFPPTAGNDVLFTALESEALKHAAPAGYTVCNDTATELLVAMGDAGAKAPVSRGWWRIASGACARTITTPLASDAVYISAQKNDGTAVVSGADKFCITPQEFEIQGRGNCATRGQVEAGFAKTATRGLSGYVAHIGTAGLKPPSQAGMSK
jgi:uncharacterized membrane protein